MHPYLTTHLVTTTVPAHLEDTARAFVTMYQLTALCAPNVNTFVKTTTRQEFAIG